MSVNEIIAQSSKSMNNDRNRSKATNLTSLDDDCLEYLFGYLDAFDLLMVADAAKQFHTAVGVVFKRKYSAVKMIIGGGHNYDKR